MSTIKIEGAESEAELDAELVEFDAALQGLGNQPLHKYEKAILKTYLIWKLKYERESVVPKT